MAVVTDRLQHHQRDRQGGGRVDLAGGCLDEVGTGRHRQHRGPAHVVEGAELTGFEDHLEMGGAARLFTARISS
jgi:hypothetical protein